MALLLPGISPRLLDDECTQDTVVHVKLLKVDALNMHRAFCHCGIMHVITLLLLRIFKFSIPLSVAAALQARNGKRSGSVHQESA